MVGTTISHCQILDKLREGGMGSWFARAGFTDGEHDNEKLTCRHSLLVGNHGLFRNSIRIDGAPKRSSCVFRVGQALSRGNVCTGRYQDGRGSVFEVSDYVFGNY